MDEISLEEYFDINEEIKKVFTKKINDYKEKNKKCKLYMDIAQSTGLSKSAAFRIINCQDGYGHPKTYEPYDYKKICNFFDSALNNATNETWEKIFQIFTFYYENQCYRYDNWFSGENEEDEFWQ